MIGGGDTGSDCVGTTNRHKARSVTQFELIAKTAKRKNIIHALAYLPDDIKNFFLT